MEGITQITYASSVEGFKLVIHDALPGRPIEVNVGRSERGEEALVVWVRRGKSRELQEVGRYDVISVEVVPGGEEGGLATWRGRKLGEFIG